MGWVNGTSICIDLWNQIREYIEEDNRAEVLSEIIQILTSYDWDCVEEIEDYWPESQEALKIYDPDIFEYSTDEVNSLLNDLNDKDLY